jgi:hypothetical protein
MIQQVEADENGECDAGKVVYIFPEGSVVGCSHVVFVARTAKREFL